MLRDPLRLGIAVLLANDPRGEPKTAAFPGLTFDFDPSAHQIDQLSGNGQPQTGAPVTSHGFRTALVISAEDAAVFVFGDSNAGVGDVTAQLERLEGLLERGTINQDEFKGFSFYNTQFGKLTGGPVNMPGSGGGGGNPPKAGGNK